MNRISTTLVFVALLAPLACDDGNPCDPDQEYFNNQCFHPGMLPTGGTTGSGGDTSGGGLGGIGGAGDGEFGRVCETNDECADPAPLCAMAPGETVGYCTISGCDTDGVECPAGYHCFDLANACVQD